jgi:hypothetical protein
MTRNHLKTTQQQFITAVFTSEVVGLTWTQARQAAKRLQRSTPLSSIYTYTRQQAEAPVCRDGNNEGARGKMPLTLASGAPTFILIFFQYVFTSRASQVHCLFIAFPSLVCRHKVIQHTHNCRLASLVTSYLTIYTTAECSFSLPGTKL